MARCCVVSLLVAFCTLLGRSEPKISYALLVGVSEYQDVHIPKLRFTASETQKLAEVLINHCGVRRENIWLLLNAAATKSNIEKAMYELARTAKPDDGVLIYFSGHGSRIPDRDGDEEDNIDEVFLPYDAIATREETYIVDDLLGYWVSRIVSENVVVVFDTCYSGGQARIASIVARSVDVFSDVSALGPGSSMVKDIFTNPTARRGRVVLAASRDGEPAWEDVELQSGVFTYYLINGIRDKKADLNRDEEVTIDELAEFIKRGVEGWSRQTGNIQTPVYENPDARKIVIVPSLPPPSIGITPQPTVPTPLPPPIPIAPITPLSFKIYFGLGNSFVVGTNSGLTWKFLSPYGFLGIGWIETGVHPVFGDAGVWLNLWFHLRLLSLSIMNIGETEINLGLFMLGVGFLPTPLTYLSSSTRQYIGRNFAISFHLALSLPQEINGWWAPFGFGRYWTINIEWLF